MEYDKTNVWPNVKDLNANCWLFAEINGKWYAVTFEFMRRGYDWRGKNTVGPEHIKRREFDNWRPVLGITYYFMVSGLCRGPLRNIQERTNIVPLIWE